MKMCNSHWEALRKAIEEKGLTPLGAEGGLEAVQRIVNQLKTKKVTLRNFDPLMSAYWAIVNNAMYVLDDIGANPLALMMAPPPDHPEWECPICYLNWLSADHDAHCTEPTCSKTRGLTFDDFIEKAAQGALETYLGLAESEKSS